MDARALGARCAIPQTQLGARSRVPFDHLTRVRPSMWQRLLRQWWHCTLAAGRLNCFSTRGGSSRSTIRTRCSAMAICHLRRSSPGALPTADNGQSCKIHGEQASKPISPQPMSLLHWCGAGATEHKHVLRTHTCTTRHQHRCRNHRRCCL